MGITAETIRGDVYAIVAEVPRGRVATYGQIATLAGWPNHSRLVGRLMCNAPEELHLPCWRVVNATGRPSPIFPQQRELLEKEGVAFKKNGVVDMKRHAWHPDDAQY